MIVQVQSESATLPGSGRPEPGRPTPLCNTGVAWGNPGGCSPLWEFCSPPTVGWGWCRATGPEEHVGELVDVLCRVVGEAPTSRAKGLHFYASGQSVGPASVSWGGSNMRGTCMIEVPGSIMDRLGWERGLAFVERVLSPQGMRLKRADLWLDFMGQGVRVVEEVEAACSRGCLHSPNTWQLVRGRNKAGGCVGATVYVGAPDSESRVRVYDKSLEQRWNVAGAWHRWEGQFKDGKAKSIGRRVIEGRLSMADARALAVGVVEWRPCPEWWDLIVDGSVQKAERVVEPWSLGEFSAHVMRTGGQVIVDAAAELGMSPGAVFELVMSAHIESGARGDRFRGRRLAAALRERVSGDDSC